MTTLNLQCGESADDAQEESGTLVPTYTTLEFGNWFGAAHIGVRFPGVSGLSGATINTATLTFRAAATDSGSFVGDWYAHDTASPAVFANSAGAKVTDRSLTTATCEGDSGDFGNWTIGGDPTFTGDGTNTIADIIQELADSYDPTAIALLHIYTSGTGERIADTYDTGTGTSPKLDIDYTAGGGAAGQPTAKRFGGVPFMGAHGAGLYSAIRQW